MAAMNMGSRFNLKCEWKQQGRRAHLSKIKRHGDRMTFILTHPPFLQGRLECAPEIG
jgi:hypothetical protein